MNSKALTPHRPPSLDLFVGCITLVVGAVLIGLSTAKPPSLEVVDLKMVPPPPNVERFTFGYNETVADLLWLRVIQDYSVCENVAGGVAHVQNVVREGRACKKGWVFQMINSITKLAPNWLLPYRSGALMLSILVDDLEGATEIFNKGLVRFPRDYKLVYYAAYHFAWEVGDPKKGADLLLVAAKEGGPNWLYALAGKLYSEAGQAELAKGVLENTLKEMPPGAKDRSRLEERLAKVNASLGKASRNETESANPTSGR